MSDFAILSLLVFLNTAIGFVVNYGLELEAFAEHLKKKADTERREVEREIAFIKGLSKALVWGTGFFSGLIFSDLFLPFSPDLMTSIHITLLILAISLFLLGRTAQHVLTKRKNSAS